MGSLLSSSGEYVVSTRDSVFRPFAFPAPSSSYTTELRGLEFIRTLGASIPIIWSKSGNTKPQKTVIFSHGNRSDIGDSDTIFEILHRLNLDVVVYDYPGYGLHKGTPSQDTCLETIRTVYDYVRKTGVASGDIILFGQSIGTGPTTMLAEQLCNSGEAPSSIILMSPYTSALGVVSSTAAATSRLSYHLAPQTLDIFDNYHHIQSVSCPVKIIHGTNDSIIAYSQGVELQVRSPSKMRMGTILGGDHNDLWYSYLDEIEVHLREAASV